MTKNISKSEEAVSPTLATLLFIVIAVAAIVATYAWIMTYMNNAGQQAGVLLKKDAPCLWQSGNITIYVRNAGTSNAEIDAVYINSEPQSAVEYDPETKIVEKDGGKITIVVTKSWTSRARYYFQISPKLGEPLSFQETSPQS